MRSDRYEMQQVVAQLLKAGAPPADVDTWSDAWPEAVTDFDSDSRAFSAFWSKSQALLRGFPKKPARNRDESEAVALVHQAGRYSRDRFLASHTEELYGRLTAAKTKFLRVDELVTAASRVVRGLVPSEDEVSVEQGLPLKDKEGLEINYGLLLSHVLARAECGRHLCHAMLLPRAETRELLPRLMKDGSVDLGTVLISRAGKASVVELRNPRALNALDETTLAPLETATDLAILDEATEIAVLRGGAVEHPKYAGRRISSAGINLTHLYQGKIPFLFYFQHVMGYEHKMVRGVALKNAPPIDVAGSTIEKPWIGVVEAFAIGGGCQHLLAMDYVLAEASAYLSLPARKEGIIPGWPICAYPDL